MLKKWSEKFYYFIHRQRYFWKSVVELIRFVKEIKYVNAQNAVEFAIKECIFFSTFASVEP